LSPYQPSLPPHQAVAEHGIQPQSIVQLASNENPLGASPKAIAAFKQAASNVHRYPDQHELVGAIAQHCAVPADMIALGNGSNDVLDLAARIYLGKGDEAISSQYSFAVYPIATASTGAKNVVVPLASDYAHDLEASLRAITPKTKLIWLDNPSNPVGAFAPYDDIEKFVRAVPRRITVVLDEAYREYLDKEERKDSISWTRQYPNLILTRTFSKMYGLAGLRIGYAIAAPQVAELLNRVRQPFNVNTPALRAAVAALGDQAFVAKSYELNKADRQQLQEGFASLGLKTLPARGNFVTVHVPQAQSTYKRLLAHGIIVRPLAGYGLPEHLRVSVGTQTQNSRLLTALADFRDKM
jgi:histidinol-phosphate aminotransferase